MFSGDPAIAVEGSDAAHRIIKYGNTFGKLSVLLLIRDKKSSLTLSDRVAVYVVSGRILRYVKGLFAGISLLQKSHYDVISAQDVEHSFLAWLLSKQFRVPWQMQIHTDIFSPYFEQHSMLNKLRVQISVGAAILNLENAKRTKNGKPR